MSMFPEVDELKARLDRLRPVPESLRPRAIQNLVEEWTYNSLVLDGLGIDLPGIRLLLRHRRTPAGVDFDELKRIDFHAEAARYTFELARNEQRRWLTETMLREIHGLSQSGEIHPAPYRTFVADEGLWSDGLSPEPAPTLGPGRRTRGSDPGPPDPLELPGRLDALFQQDAQDPDDRHAIECAASLFQGLVELQPFTEGNGPTARLFLNLRLLFLGYPALTFTSWSPEAYTSACDSAARGDLYPLVELIERELLRSARLELHMLEDRRSLTPERVGLRFQGLDEHIEVIEGAGRDESSQSPLDRARAVRRVGAEILNLLTEVRKSAHGERFSVRESGSYRQGLESDLMANVFRNLSETGISPESPQWHHEAVLEFRPNQANIIEADLFYCTFASPEQLHVVVVASILKETSTVRDEIGEEIENSQPDPSQIEVLLHDDVLTLPMSYPFEANGQQQPVPVDLENFVLAASDLFLDRILESYQSAVRKPSGEPDPTPNRPAPRRGRKAKRFRPLAPSQPKGGAD